MAVKKSGTGANKVSFGKRKGGKAKKSKGPKDKNVSKYRSQGR
jgi:hypothetical protein